MSESNERGNFLILDPSFAEFAGKFFENIVKHEASNFTINMVKMFADTVSLSAMEASREGFEEEAASAVSRILEVHTGVYAKEELDYTSVVWPSIFTSQLSENLGMDYFTPCFENMSCSDDAERVYERFGKFYENFNEWCRSGGKKGTNPGSNNSVKYKTDAKKLEMPRLSRLEEIPEFGSLRHPSMQGSPQI